MTNRIEEAFSNYKINKMVDPATRYSNDEREAFNKGVMSEEQARSSGW